MNRTLLSLLLTSTLAAAAPAFAQAQNFNQRQASASQTIDLGVRDGTLTTNEAQQLRDEFDGIARLEGQYRGYGGDVSAAQRNDLQTRTELLMRRIDYYKGNSDRASASANSSGINERQAGLDDRIQAGVRDGSLTQAEAAKLRTEYKDVARLEARDRASGRGMSQAERNTLNRRLDQLSTRIQNNRNNSESAGPGINQRQANLDDRIQAGVRDGSLTQAEAAKLRTEYKEIGRLEARDRASGRGMTPTERANLDRRLDQLSSRIQNNRNNTDDRWINLDQRQAQFNMRLNRAVSDRSVNQQEAGALRTEFNSIARIEAQYRQSRPGITDAERIDLNARFDRLENNYRYSINTRSYGNGNAQSPSLFDFLFGLSSN